MKKFKLILSAAALLSFVLAGCGKPSLTVAHQHYNPSGMTAVVKGHSNQKAVHIRSITGHKNRSQLLAVAMPSPAG